MEVPLAIIKVAGYSSFLAITLLYLTVLGTGTQSVTADRNTRRSNCSNKYKGV